MVYNKSPSFTLELHHMIGHGNIYCLAMSHSIVNRLLIWLHTKPVYEFVVDVDERVQCTFFSLYLSKFSAASNSIVAQMRKHPLFHLDEECGIQ